MKTSITNETQLYHLFCNIFEEGFNYSSNYFGGFPNRKRPLPKGVCIAASAYAKQLIQQLTKETEK